MCVCELNERKKGRNKVYCSLQYNIKSCHYTPDKYANTYIVEINEDELIGLDIHIKLTVYRL